MKKIVIPAVLGGVMLIGMFVALMPVQQAATVHTTLTTEIDSQDRFFSVFVPYNATDTSVRLLQENTGGYSGYAVVISTGGGATADGCGLASVFTTVDTDTFVSANGVSQEAGNATIPAGTNDVFLLMNASHPSGDHVGVANGCTVFMQITNLNGN